MMFITQQSDSDEKTKPTNKQFNWRGGDADVSCRVRIPEQPTPSLVVQILKCLCTGCLVKTRRPGSECSVAFQGATSKIINSWGSSRKTPPLSAGAVGDWFLRCPLVPGAETIPEFTANKRKSPFAETGSHQNMKTWPLPATDVGSLKLSVWFLCSSRRIKKPTPHHSAQKPKNPKKNLNLFQICRRYSRKWRLRGTEDNSKVRKDN